jgi:HAMP domain-containing protein
LRKCLVVATRLKNDRLKGWVLGELNGYENKEALPPYRVKRIQAKGFFVGPFQSQLRDQGLPSAILDENDRWWATTAYMMERVAAYELVIGRKDGSTIQWLADLVAAYQSKFLKDWVLNRAWQEIPAPGLAALVDTVRNRLLEFALELQGQVGDAQVPLERLAPERVETAVATIIYGGNNIIAGNVAGNVNQLGDLAIVQGDFVSLARVLEDVGVPADEIGALEKAVAEDKEAGEEIGFGARTSEWLSRALTYVGRGGGKIAGEVARATLTKALMRYLGLG